MNTDRFEKLLPQVEKPARYIGGEWNAVIKDPAQVDLRVCLAFPDLYELGLGNLGLHILYSILNDMDHVWAERTYLPGPDMEAQLRAHAMPLFMLESKTPALEADAIGFSLQSELTYVNVLKLLDLSGTPLMASERDDAMPLVFAGGPGAYNPEPLALFMDFFVVGDGEEVIVEVAQCLTALKTAGRRQKLEALAEIDGVYVPALYPVETREDGSILPRTDTKIQARFAASLNAAHFPVRMITPFVQMVHDGVGVEVLRGCSHGCRFCQAGMITRPVRERDTSVVVDLLERTLADTGLDAATLLSLSTCDHSQIQQLVHEASSRVHGQQASLALPSLRLDRFSVALADHVAPMRRSGLTFAPEAGTPRLRAVINKDVSDDQLVALAEEAFRRGWQHIKAYFMIGLPTETDADIEAVAALCARVLEAGRHIRKHVMVRTGISTFVPKPFTPFQWAAQISLDETRARQQHLAGLFGKIGRGIKYGRHAPEASYIEGLLSRADRRAGALLLSVLRHGGGYETWSERLCFDAWHAAIAETGYDAVAALGERSADAPLPWDHIDAQVSKQALFEAWQQALTATHTPDCREGICNRCGANRRAALQCNEMQARAAAGRAAEDDIALTSDKTPETRDGVQRLCFRVGREGVLRFLSHLETAQAWIRALRRANVPLAYSQGFHAHPKVTFAAALPVGEESEAEMMDVILYEQRDPETVLYALREKSPPGLNVYEVEEVDLRATALMAAQSALEYNVYTDTPVDVMGQRIGELLHQPQWPVERMVKNRRGGGPKPGRKMILLDVRPLVTALRATPHAENGTCIHFATSMQENRLAKPKEILHLLKLDPLHTRIRKTATHLNR